MKLTIELVPKTAWYKNVRSEIDSTQWDKIRRECYRKANYKCEICGGKGDKWPVECHEIWHYDDDKKLQTLKGFIALCPPCHKVKHPGLAKIRGEIDIVIKQLMQVNEIPESEALDYIEESFEIWSKRSNSNWECDISYLKEL